MQINRQNQSPPQMQPPLAPLLRFGFEEPATLITQSNFDLFIGQAVPAYEPRFLFSTFLAEDEICRCVFSLEAQAIVPKLFFKSRYLNDSAIATSIVKILILEAEQTGLSSEVSTMK